MSTQHTVALLGFSPFERSTFESFFRLAARRPPGYLLVADASTAALVVVNADDAPAFASVIANKPCPHVLLIGASDGGTGWPLQRRPLNLMKVLTTVEQLLSGTPAQAASSALARTAPVTPAFANAAPAPVASRPVSTVIPALREPMPARSAAATGFAHTEPAGLLLARISAKPQSTAPVEMPVHASVQAQAPSSILAAPLATKPLSRTDRQSVRTGAGDFAYSQTGTPILGASTRPVVSEVDNLDHILVVDDSDIALKFMRNRLTRFGFAADLVSSGEEALGRLNIRPYKFVFLDVMMEGLDGYQTCRAIKQRKYTNGRPPVVVMLTSRGGTIDKIRGTLAGCDAYLTKPLNERELINVLAKHDRTVARGFQETNFGGSGNSSDFSKSS